MRWIIALVLLAAGLGAGWWLSQARSPNAPATLAEPTIAPAASPAAPAAATAAGSSATRGSAAAGITGLPAAPARARASTSWSKEQDELSRRAYAGNGLAAAQWQDVDLTCRTLQTQESPQATGLLDSYFDDDRSRLEREGPPLPLIKPDEHALLLDRRLDLEQRKTLAQQIELRVQQLCSGYVASSLGDRYALAEIAARSGRKDAFWMFIQQPPFTLAALLKGSGSPEEAAQMRDWTRRAPAMLEQRSARGDADAVLALGMAYLFGTDTMLPDRVPPNFMLNGAVPDDPQQAYGWLSLYLQMNPSTPLSDRVQQWLAQLDDSLSEDQRDQARRWAREQRAGQALIPLED